MANPEMPTANDPPVPEAPPEPAPDSPPADTAIQEQDAVIPIPPSTAVSADAPAPPERPREVARRHAPDAEQLFARVRRLDRVLVGFVLVLAFGLGCFAIQNSDFWMHLATGRLIARGEFAFGSDPFSFTTDPGAWVNHAWLFDWLLYILYQVVGAGGLVVLRGLLLAALAEFMLRARRPGQSLWIPAVCTTLAVLVVSTHAPLAPLLVSLLLLSATLYVLRRGADENATLTLRGRSFSLLWLLPPLFALWVNLDGWFILGPLTVALYLAGSALQHFTGARAAAGPAGAPGRDEIKRLALVLGAGLAACLLNPYLHRAFVLPTDLAYFLVGILPADLVPTGVAARRATEYLGQLFSMTAPFSARYALTPAFGQNVAGLAYFPLLLLGLASVGLRVRARRGDDTSRFPVGLLLVWLLFAVLSTLNVRFLPFFAVVAGPFAIINLQEAARRPAAAPTWGQWNWAIGGRLLTALGCLLLLLLAWPGWLHGAPDDPLRSHRVSLHAYTDPSFEGVARRLDELKDRLKGKLKRGFNVQLGLPNYLAWTSERGISLFVDSRFALPAQAAADHARASARLRSEALGKFGKKGPQGLGELTSVFRKYGINYLLLSGQSAEARAMAVRLISEPDVWARLYDDGRTALFGWRDPESRENVFAGEALDFNRLAFGAVPEKRRAPLEPPAPPDGPPNFLELYAFGRPARSPAVAEANNYLITYQVLSPGYMLPSGIRRWEFPFILAAEVADSFAFATAVAPLLPGATATAPLLPAVARFTHSPTNLRVRALQRALAQNHDPGPPGLPLLAVRAARRGIAASPGEPEAQRALVRAYALLWRRQEAHWSPHLAPPPGIPLSRQLLRRVQYSFALDRAVRLKPDDVPLRLELVQFLWEMDYPDVALEHALRAQQHFPAHLARQRAGDTDRGAGLKENEERLKLDEKGTKKLDDRVKILEKEVKNRTAQYQIDLLDAKSAQDKIALALYTKNRQSRGLAGLALKLLGEIDPKTLTRREEHQLIAWLQLDLLLKLGKSKELRDIFALPAGDDTAAREGAEVRQRLKELLPGGFELVEALYCAGAGEYARAEKILTAYEESLAPRGAEAAWAAATKKLEAERNRRLVCVASTTSLFPVLQPPPVPLAAFTVGHLQELQTQAGKLGYPGLQQKVECRAVRGLLALEQGDTARAAEHFRECQRLGRFQIDFPSVVVVARYLQLLAPYHPDPKKGLKQK